MLVFKQLFTFLNCAVPLAVASSCSTNSWCLDLANFYSQVKNTGYTYGDKLNDKSYKFSNVDAKVTQLSVVTIMASGIPAFLSNKQTGTH
jgi:hypothetical protein